MGVRHRKRRRWRRFILVRRMRWLAIFALIGFSIFFPLPRDPEAPPRQPFSENRAGASVSTSPFSSTEGPPTSMALRGKPVRVVYPYSVIPGGVESVGELKNAIARDPVVSAHYAAFQLSRARIIRLDGGRSMHVSYRIGSKVYWTKRELKLAKGETLITDGIHMARTRCGNLVSKAVAEPVSPNEPKIQDMDTPLNPRDTGVLPGSDLPSGPSLTRIPGPGMPPVEVGSPPHDSGNDPIILGPPARIGIGSWPTPPSPTPVVPVPEPSTLFQVLIGLFALMLLRRQGAQHSRQRVE